MLDRQEIRESVRTIWAPLTPVGPCSNRFDSELTGSGLVFIDDVGTDEVLIRVLMRTAV